MDFVEGDGVCLWRSRPLVTPASKKMGLLKEMSRDRERQVGFSCHLLLKFVAKRNWESQKERETNKLQWWWRKWESDDNTEETESKDDDKKEELWIYPSASTCSTRMRMDILMSGLDLLCFLLYFIFRVI